MVLSFYIFIYYIIIYVISNTHTRYKCEYTCILNHYVIGFVILTDI